MALTANNPKAESGVNDRPFCKNYIISTESHSKVLWRAPNHLKERLPWRKTLEMYLALFQAANAAMAFASETHVKRGQRAIQNGTKDLVEKLGRNDLCPCDSGRKFQEPLSEIGQV
jgi:hypothetical protein